MFTHELRREHFDSWLSRVDFQRKCPFDHRIVFDSSSSHNFWTQVTFQTHGVQVHPLWLSFSSPLFCRKETPHVFPFPSSDLQLWFPVYRVFFLFRQCSFWSRTCLKRLWQQPAVCRFMWLPTSVRTIKTFFFAKSCLFQTARLWYAISVVIVAVTADCGWSEAWDCSYV